MNGETSGWQLVTSGVLQGSILSSVLLNMVINNLDTGLKEILNKFVEDTKLGGAGNSLEDREALQRDIEKLERWAVTNCMKLKGKCWILHLGWRNPSSVCRQ